MDDRGRPALVPALRRLEQDARERGMPPGARHRITARLREEADRREREAAPRRWLPALTFLAGAALVMLVVGSGMRTSAPVVHAGAEVPRQLGAWTLSGDDCTEATDAERIVLRGRCRLVSAAMVVETWDETHLRDGAEGLSLLSGHALFEVGKVAAGAPPVRVEVSHGRIEVLGTRFTVEQGAGGGHVDLFEGRIRFVSVRREVDVWPGQRLGWGDRAQPVRVADLPIPAPAPEAGAPDVEPAVKTPARPRPRSEKTPSASAVIAEVASLRAQKRWRDAAGVLRRALRGRWDDRTAEVLSYELGRLLERQLHDREGACAHWRAHAERFGRGRYADAVRDAIARCE